MYMKSKILSFQPVRTVIRAIDSAARDGITIFAAQSSFFICISAIPLAVLVISLSRLLSPDTVTRALGVVREALPASARDFFDTVAEETAAKSDVSLVSFAALGLLWTASRGVSALTEGISAIYGSNKKVSFAAKAARSILFTLSSVVVITSVLAALVFGGGAPSHYRGAIVFFALIILFALVYSRAGGNGLKESFPGAVFSAVGWTVFSFAYSFYFDSFPRLSYLYGSLAAVVFFMLWVYFCVLILMFGAEINKNKK